MKKVEARVAEAYYKTRVKYMLIYLSIWAIVSFGVVGTAEFWAQFTINGMPAHYFMGAQGSILIFIVLLFINAIVNDKIDQTFGIDHKQNERISAEQGNTVQH
ncbi:sodium/substrate symporter small subunit [Caldalkalibacillus salinus]|uniref:sodium/substrate symporter small subunit n=1 Tax=Caldalkalibacillus salinus TaxID=2803787 RepID=UPI001924C94C